jgi:asparagine synthase (glutamine-hydrolysing)
VEVRGSVFDGDRLLTEEEIAALVGNLRDRDAFTSWVSRLNGFFAIIVQRDDALFAAVDRIRSLPLFYGVDGTSLYLSDDATWVRRRFASQGLDSLARAEFLATGYVTGPDTLVPQVHQLQAGEALIGTFGTSGIKMHTKRYYQFLPQTSMYGHPREFLRDLDEALHRATRRLMTVAAGRPIILPLSGGYDSRLIATLLKENRYRDVITFSYGRPGNREARISQEVAVGLGYSWHFVPYIKQFLINSLFSSDYDDYQDGAHNLSCLPHSQDWPAASYLKRNGYVPADGMYCPGHGGFLCGGHVPIEMTKYRYANTDALATLIWKKHYNLNVIKNKYVVEQLKNKIIRVSQCDEIHTGLDVIKWFEYWEWQERQAKFITNSVRVYEFLGHDWWMPLWDGEAFDLWSRVPLSWRAGKRMYIDFVAKRYAGATGFGRARAARSNRSAFIQALKRWIRRRRGSELVEQVYSGVRVALGPGRDDLGWEDVIRVAREEEPGRPKLSGGIHGLAVRRVLEERIEREARGA